MGLLDSVFNAGVHQKSLFPQISDSKKYKHWVSINDGARCNDCETMHGKIWERKEKPMPEPPLHPNGRCKIKTMNTIKAGTATINGVLGADWMLKHENKLPSYYITKDKAYQSGWKH